jgi:hypothetical protein
VAPVSTTRPVVAGLGATPGGQLAQLIGNRAFGRLTFGGGLGGGAAQSLSAPRPSAAAAGGGTPLQRNPAAAVAGFGEALLGFDAAVGPEEAVAGPPGWALALGLGVVGGAAVGIGYLMSGGGRPNRNTDQNKQFADAVQEIQRRIGRRLTADEVRQLHEALHGEEDPGYHDIVELGVNMFGGAATGSAPNGPEGPDNPPTGGPESEPTGGDSSGPSTPSGSS